MALPQAEISTDDHVRHLIGSVRSALLHGQPATHGGQVRLSKVGPGAGPVQVRI